MITKDTKTPWMYLLGAGIAGYIVTITYLSILRMESFSASVYDLGIMIQTIWNTSQGHWLQESVNMGYPMMRFWMAHWEFIYVLIALCYKILPSAYTILFLQTAVVALGALPIYWLAKQKLNHEPIAFAFALGYLLYPAIQNANLADVHGVTFAAPFLLYAFYFLLQQKKGLFTLFAALAILSREDSALILFMMGGYAFFELRQRKQGLLIAAVAGLWFLLWYQRMTIRALLGLPEFVIMEGAEAHWDHLGHMAQDPFYLFKFLAKKYNIYYFIFLFGPVLLLSFFDPKTLLIASPMFAINLLSSYYYTHDVEHYYSATIAAFIFISAIMGTRRLLGYFDDAGSQRHRLNYLAMALIAAALAFFAIKSNVFDVKKWQVTDHHRVIKKIMRLIPPGASLSAEHKLLVHTAARRELYVFNDNVGAVDYILYDFYAPRVNIVSRKQFNIPFTWPDNDSIRKVLRDPRYGIVAFEDGVCLLQKGANYEAGLQMLALAQEKEISQPGPKEIAPNLKFLGYRPHETLRYYYEVSRLGDIAWKRALHITCYWQSTLAQSEATSLLFRMQHDSTSFYKSQVPVFGLYPLAQWPSDEIIRDELFWELPDSARPGSYQLSVSLTGLEPQGLFVPLLDVEIK